MDERQAWVCERCRKDWHANPHQNSVTRVFQQPGEPEPTCSKTGHGKMVPQLNARYRANGVRTF